MTDVFEAALARRKGQEEGDVFAAALARRKQPSAASDPSGEIPPGTETMVPRRPLKRGMNWNQRAGIRLREDISSPFALLDQMLAEIRPHKTSGDAIEKKNTETVFPWGRGPIGRIAGPLTAPHRAVVDQAISIYRDWKKDPANIPADLFSFYVMGKVFSESPGIKKPPKPRMLDIDKLTPEQRTQYIEMVDKANEAYGHYRTKDSPQGAAGEYTEKMSKLFDEAKQKQINAKTAAESKFASDLHDYLDNMTNLFDKAKVEQLESEAAHASEVSKVEAQNAEAMENYRQKVRGVERSEAIEGGKIRYAKRIKTMVDQTHKRVRSYLDSRWNSLRAKNKMEVLNSQAIEAKLEQARDMLKGQPEDLKLFNEILDQVTQKNAVIDESGGDKRVLRPMTWEEGRVSYTNLGDKRWGASGLMRKALGAAQDAVGEELDAAADRAGTGKEYQSLKKDWTQYMQDWHDMSSMQTGGGSPLARIFRMKDAPYIVKQILGGSSERLFESVARWNKFGGDLGDMEGLRRLAKEAEQIPKKRPTPPKAEPVPEKPPTTIKEFMKVPKIPSEPGDIDIPVEKSYPTPPRLTKIKPMPDPKVARATAIARRIGRVTGKIAGGAIGAKMGHPLIGYGAGGEAGEDFAAKLRELMTQMNSTGAPK